MGLSVRDAIFKNRRELKKQTFPVKIKQYFKNILESGNVFPIDETINERRKALGLEPIALEKIRDEIKKFLAEATE